MLTAAVLDQSGIVSRQHCQGDWARGTSDQSGPGWRARGREGVHSPGQAAQVKRK